MRESRSSGSVEGVMGNHGSYSDFENTMRGSNEDQTTRRRVDCTMVLTNTLCESR